MTLDELERIYQRAREAGAGGQEHQALVEALLMRDDLDAVMYHFELLRDPSLPTQGWELGGHLR